MKDLGQRIIGRWLHSHEEDTAERLVYRRASYAFPPARGRDGFDFGDDGRVVLLGFAAADGAKSDEGTWAVEHGTDVKLTRVSTDPSHARVRTLHVLSCDADMLTVSAA